jgi:hypothetical protein
MASIPDKKTFLGSLTGRILCLFGRRPPITKKDMQKIEFKTSTQRLGLHFAEKIRNVFRHKWLKRQ